MGFYTTRFFEAENLEEAEFKASESIRNDPKLENVLVQTHAAEPVFRFDEVTKLDGKPPQTGWWPFRRNAYGGFVLYAMKNNEE